MNGNRQEDLLNVFNKRYTANHSSKPTLSGARADFSKKMFGTQKDDNMRENMRKANSVDGRVNSLRENINAVRDWQRKNISGGN